MKNLLSRLESVSQSMTDKIESREETFSSRSWQWQESEKGEAHEEKTQELQMILDDLDNVINDFQEFLDNQ